MKKKRVFIFFISIQFIFTPMAMAHDGDISQEAKQQESMSIEELSSRIESYLPDISHEEAAQLAEAIYLVEELEREIFLTTQLIELRETGGVEEAEAELPKEKEVPRVETPKEEMPKAPIVEKIAKGSVPEKLVVAKHISKQAGQSLPREEKSLAKELEKKGVMEKAKPAPTQEGEVFVKKTVEKGILSVVIEKEQTVVVPTVGLKRFTVTDPELLSAVREDGKIDITGTALGKSFLHIWDSEGRRTIQFTIRPKGYAKFAEVKGKALKAEKLQSFNVEYSFDRSRLNSKSLNADRSYHNTSWVHSLGISGGTPWGRTVSRFNYKGKEAGGGVKGEHDLSSWFWELWGDDLEMAIGNTSADFSEITLPSTGYQGMRFRNPKTKDINYEFVWGAKGSRMWGYRIEEWTNENYFEGARAEIKPADFIHFNTTFLRALEDDITVAKHVYAGGTGLSFLDDTIKIEGEAARCKREEKEEQSHAYKIDTTVNFKDYKLLLKGTYRDIDPDFMTVTGGGISHVSELGYYFDAEYNPLKYLRLKGNYNVYREMQNFNPAEPFAYNYDWRGNVDFAIGPATHFSYAKWERIYEGQSSPSRARGDSYYISHGLSLEPLMRSARFGLSYGTNQSTSLSNHSSDTRDKRYGCNMTLNVMKNLYYDISHNWYHRHKTESGELATLRTFSTGVSYSTQILDTPFYSSMGLRYYNEKDVAENLPLSSAENYISGDGEIRYNPSPDMSTYLRVSQRRICGVLDPTKDRRETLIYGGGRYVLDTTLRFGEGGSLKGTVFNDLNANGIKDAGEEGIPKINIYAGEYRSIVTDASGEFEFRRLREDENLVMYDTKLLPKGYKCTTANPQTVELKKGLVTEVNFGVAAIGEISGKVFNDVNMNGKFDDGEIGVGGILLALGDGKMAQTMGDGYYRMLDVRAGTAILTLDTITLPFNLLPLAEAKKTIEVKAGEYYEENFPLYALRTVIGTVFVDENGNNRLDTGEKGVADVVLKCADSTAITDNTGRFFLKKLPGGKQEVILDVKSIPAGYELSVEPSRAVELLIEGEIKEDVNFPLRKK